MEPKRFEEKEIVGLIDKLKRNTQSGKAWLKSEVDKEFILEVAGLKVKLAQYEYKKNLGVRLWVCNSSGQPVWIASFGQENMAEYDKMFELYRLAEKSYYDETLKRLYAGLG